MTTHDISDEGYLNLHAWIEKVNAVILPSGGMFTVDAIVRRMEANGDFQGDDMWTPALKQAVVRRVIEWQMAFTKGRKTSPAFLCINVRTGEMISRRPRGISLDEADGEVLIEPTWDNKEWNQ
jgi:hypothetical protein